MNDRQMNVCYKLHRSQEDESRIVSFVKSYLQNLKVETGWNTYSFSIENLMVNYLQNQAEISCQNCIWLLYTDIFYPWSPQVRLCHLDALLAKLYTSLSLRFNDHFPGEPGLPSFIGTKDKGSGGHNWSYKTCKAPVKSSPPTNQHPTFYRPDALPVAQPTVSNC